MPKLKEEHKVFIVQSLACFKSPTEIADELKVDFKVEASLPQISAYSPSTVNGARLSAELKDLFARTREEFIRETTAHGIAHQSYRLAELQDMQKRAKKQRNYALAAQLLEQAAKEVGGLYTNRRKLDVADPRQALADLLGVAPNEIPTDETVH